MIKKLAIAALALSLTACSYETVPPAAKGKILSGSGYSADVKETGKHMLYWWENMIILDTSTQRFTEKISVKMKDNLDLPFTVDFRTRIHGSDDVINAMFNDITHTNYKVGLDKVYSVYGKNIVTNAARSVMGKYRVNEVAANFDKISSDIQAEINKRMVNSPLEVSNVTLAEISYPVLITTAIEKQQERELDIKTEENQQAIELLKKQNQMELAKADYEIRMIKAKAIRDENIMTSEGLNPMLLKYRALEVQEKMAESENKVFVPYESLNQVGVSNSIYK